MRLETERLVIRELKLTDAATFVRMAADGSLAESIGFDADCGTWMDEWIEKAIRLSEQDDPRGAFLAYTIETKDEQEVVGSVGCSYYEDLNQVGVTYFIGANVRNRGYAAEAVRAFVPYFFEHFEEEALIANILQENVPSQKVAEQAGFLLKEVRMYRDSDDKEEKLYRFYYMRRPASGAEQNLEENEWIKKQS